MQRAIGALLACGYRHTELLQMPERQLWALQGALEADRAVRLLADKRVLESAISMAFGEGKASQQLQQDLYSAAGSSLASKAADEYVPAYDPETGEEIPWTRLLAADFAALQPP